MDAVLIGYFPKPTVRTRKGWGAARNVEELCNLGHYTNEGPSNWVDQWKHNEMWLFDSEEMAREVIADAIEVKVEPDPNRDPPWQVHLCREQRTTFDFYAYKMLPTRFNDGLETQVELPPLDVAPLPDDYERLGYDAVNKTCCPHFECSPLFCNGMADEIPVNRYCLIDEPERALEVARDFSIRKPEPGTYFTLEVWRKGSTPGAGGRPGP